MRGDRKKGETRELEIDLSIKDRVIDIRAFKSKRIPQKSGGNATVEVVKSRY